MDPRVLMFLANTDNLSLEEVASNAALIRLYVGGLIEAQWEEGQPLFSISVTGDEEYTLMYAQAQPVIEE